MVTRGWWDVTEIMVLRETTFGATLTAGAWLPVALAKRFRYEYRPVRKPIVGLNRQNPAGWTTVKELHDFTIETEALKAVASPVYDPYTMVQYIIEKLAAADGSPGFVLDSFSLGAKVDLATDEFFWLKGATLDQVDIIGRAVDDLVQYRLHGIAQSGDYGTTDYVSGTATRQAQPTNVHVPFGECDVMVGAGPTSIIDDCSSFRLSLGRTLTPRGVDATTSTLYREFVPTKRSWTVEIERDFDDKTDFENFIDDTEVKCTIKIPSAVGGKIYTLTGGYWMPGSGVPVEELDLMSVKLIGEFAELAVTTHGA